MYRLGAAGVRSALSGSGTAGTVGRNRVLVSGRAGKLAASATLVRNHRTVGGQIDYAAAEAAKAKWLLAWRDLHEAMTVARTWVSVLDEERVYSL